MPSPSQKPKKRGSKASKDARRENVPPESLSEESLRRRLASVEEERDELLAENELLHARLRQLAELLGAPLATTSRHSLPRVPGLKEFEQVAVLVSDLSGLTKSTREHGIIHTASVIMRLRQFSLPILHTHGVLWQGFEADNLICVMPNGSSAAMAACSIREACSAHNASLAPGREHFQIQLSCIGIHVGTVLADRLRLYGQVFEIAYHLGEEVGSGGMILVTEQVKTELDPTLFEARHTELDPEQPVSIFELHRLGVVDDPASLLVPFDDSRYLPPSLVQLARRHGYSLPELSVHDLELDRAYTQRATCLMFDLEPRAQEANDEAGSISSSAPKTAAKMAAAAHEGVRARFATCELVRPILVSHGGVEVEDTLWLFTDPEKAVRGALGVQQALSPKSASPLLVRGLGIHTGTLLVINGTDVHWGDPVNTASKLGEDLARGGNLYVSEAVLDASIHGLQELDYTSLTLTKSNVNFRCFHVTKGKALGSSFETFVRRRPGAARTSLGGATASVLGSASVQGFE